MPHITKKQAAQMGVPRHTIQTILMPKGHFTLTRARSWLKTNGYRSDDMRMTANERRFMQINPIRGAEYYSKVLPNGVILTYQYY
jgi:hypothetical protein